MPPCYEDAKIDDTKSTISDRLRDRHSSFVSALPVISVTKMNGDPTVLLADLNAKFQAGDVDGGMATLNRIKVRSTQVHHTSTLKHCFA